jgi:hypothetical protein
MVYCESYNGIYKIWLFIARPSVVGLRAAWASVFQQSRPLHGISIANEIQFILPLYVIAKKTTDDNFTSVTAKFVERLDAKVRATAWNGTINYPLPEPDACKTLIDSACPLESGDLATYKLSLRLIPILPSVSSH